MLAQSTFCLFVLLIACINAQAQICTPTAVNTNLTVHLRTKNNQATVQLGCANRKDMIDCRFYSPYRTFICNAYEGGCESPRYALIDGECCDIGGGCPGKPAEKPVETPVEPPAETPVETPVEPPSVPNPVVNSVCKTTAVNSNVSVHVRTSSPSSLVMLVCPNRDKIQCRYYSPYRTFTCTAYDQPCADSRYITVDGVCCDIGFGCPKPQDPYGPLESRVTILEGYANSQKTVRAEIANLTAEFLRFSSAQTSAQTSAQQQLQDLQKQQQQQQQQVNVVDARDVASTKQQQELLQQVLQQQLQLQQQQHQQLETQVKNEEKTASIQQQLQQLQQQPQQQQQLQEQQQQQLQQLQQLQKQLQSQQQQLQKQQQQLVTLEEQNTLLKKALEVHLKKQAPQRPQKDQKDQQQQQQQQQQKYPKEDYSNIQDYGYAPAKSEENQAAMTFLLIVIVMGVLGAISILVAVIIHKKKQARLTFRE